MGVCSSQPEASETVRNKLVERSQKNAQEKVQDVMKLLLLGAGESGKSTLFKQTIMLFSNYSVDDCKYMTKLIHENCITSMQALITRADEFAMHNGMVECLISSQLADSKQMIKNYTPDHGQFTREVANALSALWADPAIKHTFSLRARYHIQIPETVTYFYEKLNEISAPDYIPSYQDVLRARVRTTGIVETSFFIKGVPFKLLDVGGQRNERKKWIHCFENVTAILFVAALSEYDQVCFEDDVTNKLDEALYLVDLFEEKIKRVPLTVWAPDIDFDPFDSSMSKHYIEATFLNHNRQRGKQIYTYITCATNSDNVKFVFDSVKDIVIRINLRQGGLLS